MKKVFYEIVMPFLKEGMWLFCDLDVIQTLKEKLVAISTDLEGIQAAADAEERTLSAEEVTKLDELFALFDDTNKEIGRREKIASASAVIGEPEPIKTVPQTPAPQNVNHAQAAPATPAPAYTGVRVGDHGGGTHGFKNLGDFAVSVKAASAPGGQSKVDPRLVLNAPTTYSNEGTGSDGGFAIPPDFRAAIKEKVMGETSLLGRTDQMITSSNSMTFPKDETTAWQTSGGIQSYWEGEASQMTQSKVALESELLKLNKLTTLVPVTEELLEDAPALNAYLRRKAPQKMDFKITDAIINGTGVGMPTGILNAPVTITVAKETSQVADTVVYDNIIKMYSRMYAPSRPTAVWLINQDIEPQLHTMQQLVKNVAGAENVGGVPVYLPANGVAGAPYSTLMGRPVIPTQACQTLGDKGDIILADMTEYVTAQKAAGIRADVSIHLWFDYDVTAFRFILRVTGQPWWSVAIDPLHGTNTLAPFVTLAERA